MRVYLQKQGCVRLGGRARAWEEGEWTAVWEEYGEWLEVPALS